MSEVIEKIETEIKTVASEVKAEFQKAEVAVETVEKAARIDVTVAEKLTIRELQLEYMQIQMDLRTLSERALSIQKNFKQTIEVLAKRYSAEGEYVWNELAGFFQRIEKKL